MMISCTKQDAWPDSVIERPDGAPQLELQAFQWLALKISIQTVQGNSATTRSRNNEERQKVAGRKSIIFSRLAWPFLYNGRFGEERFADDGNH